MGGREVESPIHRHLLLPVQSFAGSSQREPVEDPAHHQKDLRQAELMPCRDHLESWVAARYGHRFGAGGLLKMLLELYVQFLDGSFQSLRPGTPPIARSTQVPHFGAKCLDPLLQVFVLCLPEISASLEESRQHPPRAAIRWGFLVGCLETFTWRAAASVGRGSLPQRIRHNRFLRFGKPNYR